MVHEFEHDISIRSILLGNGPRVARDAFGPVLCFYLGWKFVGLGLGIALATAFGIGAWTIERRAGRSGAIPTIALIFVFAQAAVGLGTGSARWYLAVPLFLSAGLGVAFIGSVFRPRSLAGTIAGDMYDFPAPVLASNTYRRVFAHISIVFGIYQILRAGLRGFTLAGWSVDVYVVVQFLTGAPITAVLMAGSTYYAVWAFGRSDEFEVGTVPGMTDGVRAVIFDLGGVIFPSPFDAFGAYERANGLPDDFIRTTVASAPGHGAWGRLERGDVSFDEFCVEFRRECEIAGGTVDPRALVASIATGGARPEMLRAVDVIRSRGLRTAALTNNWRDEESKPTDVAITEAEASLDGHFDVIVESAAVGLRKPDPRIYELVCERLGVQPHEAVFLDDLGVNLGPARAMGMHTIKVTDAGTALEQLEGHLGFPLT